MSQDPAPNDREKGPLSFEYWKAVLAGAPTPRAVEFAVITDAWIVGEDREGYGPFRLLNTLAGSRHTREGRPSVVLRAETSEMSGRAFDSSPMEETDTSRYHGGGINDEITALVSLELGIRLKPGRLIRDFRFGDDPRGRPREFEDDLNPVLLTSGRVPILPYATGQHSLNDVKLLGTLPLLQPGSAVALVRAARLYQDALWISEAEPHLAWLMFVSAIESAAQHWKVEDVPPVDLLKEVNSSLYEILSKEGKERLIERVADEIAPLLKPTKKFITFIMTHLPDAPTQRPPEAFRQKWSRNAIGKSLSTIYEHRSRALHNGTPFPMPMCRPPHSYGDGSGSPPEIPPGLASSTLGATWVKKDIPMLLHTFEYIVRHALLKWWRSMLPE